MQHLYVSWLNFSSRRDDETEYKNAKKHIPRRIIFSKLILKRITFSTAKIGVSNLFFIETHFKAPVINFSLPFCHQYVFANNLKSLRVSAPPLMN